MLEEAPDHLLHELSRRAHSLARKLRLDAVGARKSNMAVEAIDASWIDLDRDNLE